jgi:cell division protein ZapA (FtsZ GTPase activity inhibitor)
MGVGWIRKILAYVGVVLAAILTFLGMIQYGKKLEKISEQARQGKEYKETRERIDEATTQNPTDDPSIALDRLRKHYKP